jgi:hypothetical protein
MVSGGDHGVVWREGGPGGRGVTSGMPMGVRSSPLWLLVGVDWRPIEAFKRGLPVAIHSAASND